MLRHISFSACFLLFTLGFGMAFLPRATAQTGADLQGWGGVELKRKFSKRISLAAQWQSRFDNNISRLRRNYVYVNADYRVSKWASVLVQYRFSTNPFSDAHRFRGGAVLKYRKKKWEVSDRLVYQAQYGFLDAEWMDAFGPDRALRNRIQVSRDLPKKLGVQVSAEPSWSPGNGEQFVLTRIRYVAALQVDLGKRKNLELFYLLQPRFHVSQPSYTAALGLTLSVELPGGVKKDKKEKKKEKKEPSSEGKEHQPSLPAPGGK